MGPSGADVDELPEVPTAEPRDKEKAKEKKKAVPAAAAADDEEDEDMKQMMAWAN